MGFRRQAVGSGCPGADSDTVVHSPLVGSDWVGSGHWRHGQADGEGQEPPADQLLHDSTPLATCWVV